MIPENTIILVHKYNPINIMSSMYVINVTASQNIVLILSYKKKFFLSLFFRWVEQRYIRACQIQSLQNKREINKSTQNGTVGITGRVLSKYLFKSCVL